MITKFTEPNNEISNKINETDRNNNIFVYSPAHIEELAVSEMRDSYPHEDIKRDLRLISALTSNLELLPYIGNNTRVINNDGIYLCDENPFECYKRVTKNYYELNNYCEEEQKELLKNFKENNYFSTDAKELNNIQPENIFHLHFHQRVMIGMNYIHAMRDEYNEEIIHEEAIAINFSEIKNSFKKVSVIIEILANILEAYRYHAEATKKNRPRSRLHDVSHIIYASYCDKFISNDARLRIKAKAIYSYLKIPCQVLSTDEWQIN